MTEQLLQRQDHVTYTHTRVKESNINQVRKITYRLAVKIILGFSDPRGDRLPVHGGGLRDGHAALLVVNGNGGRVTRGVSGRNEYKAIASKIEARVSAFCCHPSAYSCRAARKATTDYHQAPTRRQSDAHAILVSAHHPIQHTYYLFRRQHRHLNPCHGPHPCLRVLKVRVHDDASWLLLLSSTETNTQHAVGKGPAAPVNPCFHCACCCLLLWLWLCEFYVVCGC